MRNLALIFDSSHRWVALVSTRNKFDDWHVLPNGTDRFISVVWWSGVVVSTLALINEVNLHRTRLVLRWVTVSGSIPVPDIYFSM